MDPSKLYVPDPQKWMKFYKNMADGKIKLFSTNQIGGGLNSNSFIAPIDKYVGQSEQSPSTDQTPVKLVSTTEQFVDQAKQELKREGEDLKGVVKAMKSHKKKRRLAGRIVKRNKRSKTSNKARRKATKSGKKSNPMRKRARKQHLSRKDIFD